MEVISKDSDLYRYKKQWECSELNNPVGFLSEELTSHDLGEHGLPEALS